jgi:hypothetical protein
MRTSFRRRLRTVACCLVLELAATMGLPMRAEQIQDLMRVLNAPKIARTNPADDEKGEPQKTPRRRSPMRTTAL